MGMIFWSSQKSTNGYSDVVLWPLTSVKDVKTVYNNDHDNSAKIGVGSEKEYIETSEGRLVDAKGAKGRYVRLFSNGNTSNDMNHMIEVEVYGRPAK